MVDLADTGGPREGAAPGAGAPDVLRALMACRPVLMAFIVSVVRDFAAAESVCQDVFVHATQNAADRPAELSFEAWALELAKRRALALMRARDDFAGRAPSEAYVAAVERVVGAMVASPQERWVRRKKNLRDGFKALPVHLRRVLELRYGKNLAPAAIAERLQMQLSDVHDALAKGRREIEARLRPQPREGSE
ncbi:MAG: RNA polymerase sigma factor [Planctomycetes bacterium]|nr:RNA polymerase sigma factor [Planctomycetota bacterium]